MRAEPETSPRVHPPADPPAGTRRGPDPAHLWLLLTAAGLMGGSVAVLADADGVAQALWAATTVIGIVPLLVSTIRSVLHRRSGVDLIALLAMAAALALGEYLTGAIIALMLASGRALEAFADHRARRELSSLLARAPRTAHRYEDGALRTVAVEEIGIGDRLLVKQGEVIPVDGLASSHVVLDESALTGEARPVEHDPGDQVRSGSVNGGGAFELRAVATAATSTFAGIVRLVESAQAQKAPFVRLADRYASIFIPVTITIAGAAWALSGDPVRTLAVLVVATPCPLILAAPIAIVAGISRAAKRGVIVKGGGALETLARGTVLLFDKTGTLTAGVPRVAEVERLGSLDDEEVLRLGASLDQVSPHVLATAIVAAAHEHGLELTFPTDTREHHGSGITGVVGDRRVAVGKAAWLTGGAPLTGRARSVRRRAALEGASAVFVAVDDELAGAFLIDDPIRADTPRVIRSLRTDGIRRIVMVTGDHPDVAESVGVSLGVDRVLSERDPEDKVNAVRAERGSGVAIMVGDGLNDAPALAAADVGVAMGARGATASSEAADVVLAVDRLDRVGEAVRIARRSRRVALQSVLAGMGMSFAAMFFGAFGLLVPVAGALVQEAIDVAVILNALRALRGGGEERARRGPASLVGEPFRHEHRSFAPELRRIRMTADHLDTLPDAERRGELDRIRAFLSETLVAHERREEAEVYPAVAKLMGGEDPLAALNRAHLEIAHLTRLYEQLLDALPPDELPSEDATDLRRVLYGSHAILRLHFAQEDEAYAWLAAGAEEPERGEPISVA